MLPATLTGSFDSAQRVWIRTGFEQNGVSRYRLEGSTSTEPAYLEVRHSVRNRGGILFDAHNLRVQSVQTDANGKQFPTTSNFTFEVPRTTEVTALTEVALALTGLGSLLELASGEIAGINDDGLAFLLGDY